MSAGGMSTQGISVCLGGGGVCLSGGGVCLSGGGVCLGGVCREGVPRQGGRQPPVNRIIDRCKNITFP